MNISLRRKGLRLLGEVHSSDFAGVEKPHDVSFGPLVVAELPVSHAQSLHDPTWGWRVVKDANHSLEVDLGPRELLRGNLAEVLDANIAILGKLENGEELTDDILQVIASTKGSMI